MQKEIQEKIDKLIENGFYKCIDSMSKRCKLIILARDGFIKYHYK